MVLIECWPAAHPGDVMLKDRRMNEFYQKLQKYDQRIPDFEIAVSGIGESYPTHPGVPKKLIRDTSEKTFQRAIFFANKIKIHLTNKQIDNRSFSSRL